MAHPRGVKSAHKSETKYWKFTIYVCSRGPHSRNISLRVENGSRARCCCILVGLLASVPPFTTINAAEWFWHKRHSEKYKNKKKKEIENAHYLLLHHHMADGEFPLCYITDETSHGTVRGIVNVCGLRSFIRLFAVGNIPSVDGFKWMIRMRPLRVRHYAVGRWNACSHVCVCLCVWAMR